MGRHRFRNGRELFWISDYLGFVDIMSNRKSLPVYNIILFPLLARHGKNIWAFAVWRPYCCARCRSMASLIRGSSGLRTSTFLIINFPTSISIVLVAWNVMTMGQSEIFYQSPSDFLQIPDQPRNKNWWASLEKWNHCAYPYISFVQFLMIICGSIQPGHRSGFAYK